VMDPLDQGTPGIKSWREFALQFSAYRVLSWLISELNQFAPDFLGDIRQRFDDAYANSDSLAEEGEGWDPNWITLDTPGYEYWTDRAGAADLFEQLFPFSERDIGVEYQARCLILVGFHSALDHYLVTISDQAVHGPLPQRIKKYFAAHRLKLSIDEYDSLIAFDESRHLIVHNRGVVTEGYRDNVRYNRLQIGETRQVSDKELWNWGDLVWDLAVRLRSLSETTT
jgi:hypothetical protein